MDAKKRAALRSAMGETVTHLRYNRFAEAEKTLSSALELVHEAAENERLAAEMGYDKNP